MNRTVYTVNVKGPAADAVQAATRRGFVVFPGSPRPTNNGQSTSFECVHAAGSDTAIHTWFAKAPGMAPYPVGTLLYFRPLTDPPALMPEQQPLDDGDDQ